MSPRSLAGRAAPLPCITGRGRPPADARAAAVAELGNLHGPIKVAPADELVVAPDGVYDRVDDYIPSTNRWRQAPPLPTARHGIFPLLHDGRVYVAAGGARAGFAQSAVLEILDLL